MGEKDAGPRADELNALVTEMVERFERDGEAALQDLCRAHPEHAAALRRRFELLLDAGVLTAPRELEVPDQLGEFKLVRLLGGGGMGVVYLALQEPLGREVALKIVRPEHLYFPGTRERFRREVDTIARLQHPGIVPIYAVGEENGVPYFAMEHVRGRSLQNALDELHGRQAATLAGHDLAPASNDRDYLFRGTWEQACLRVVRQVAEALEYAHQQGVLHRDIKPSNIMLTSHGTSRAMLLDFGLATASGTTRLTRSGAQLGTLHYMSPEQASGNSVAVSARSDVYSLGVTLYELLTLRRPFDGTSDVEIALAIEGGHCKRLRELNPTLGEDAEIVCMTALEHEPARRYASAADFARDLGNVLDHHPIEARRPSTMLRARKWVRRHPATSVALALGALVVVGGPALYAWQQMRAAKLVLVQRDRAESNLQQALAAVDRMLTRVSDEDLRFEPRMEKLRATLLQDAVDLLQNLLAAQANDPRLQLETAGAHERVGKLLSELGRTDESLRAFDAAIALLSEPASALELDQARNHLLARIRVERMSVVAEGNDVSAAQKDFEQLDADLEALTQRWPDDVELRALVTSALAQRGSMLRDSGDHDGARRLFERAFAEQERIVAVSDDPEQARQLGEIANEYAVLLLEGTPEGQHNQEAEHLARRAVEMFERVATRQASDGQARYKLATVRGNLAGVLRRAGDSDGARELYEQARSELEAVVRDFPDTPWFDLELATVLNQIGLLEDLAGRNADAARSYQGAVEHLEALARRLPENHTILHRLGTSTVNLAAVLHQMEGPARARPLLEQAIHAQQRAVELAPERGYQSDLAATWGSLQKVLFDLGDLRGCVDAADNMARAEPDNWRWRTIAAAACARCLQAYRDRGDLPRDELDRLETDLSNRAVAHLHAALERGMTDPNEIPTVEVLDPLHGTPAFEQLLRELK